MKEPDTAGDYDEHETQAAYSVLIELGQVLGAFRGKFVVVGGAVPWLLLPNAEPAHVGTLDIDLDLDPVALGDGEYANFVKTLEKAGYERGVDGLRKFQLRRRVTIDNAKPISVIIDLLMPRETRLVKNRPPIVDDFAVQRADGAAIALQCNVSIPLKGKMPDGRNNSVDMLFATIPASLVMKGYALVGRDKKKDAYDIYYSIRNYPGGPAQLGADCNPLLDNEIARIGFGYIARKFCGREDFGPQTVRAFMTESAALGEMTLEQVQDDSYRQVRAFLETLGIVT